LEKDGNLNYQYRAFWWYREWDSNADWRKIWLSRHMQSALAFDWLNPKEACTNLQQLASEGIFRNYGFYEAVDYTAHAFHDGNRVL